MKSRNKRLSIVIELVGYVGNSGIPKRIRNALRETVGSGGLLLAVGMLAGFAFTTSAFAIVDKPFVAPIMDVPADGTAVDVEADRLLYDSVSGLARAVGTVRMIYGPYILVATEVSYNRETGAFTANGSVELREPNGNILQADVLALRDKFKAGFARHVKALLTNDVTITAAYVKRSVDGITIFENAHYTACKECSTDGGDPLWEIVTDETRHDSSTKTFYHTNPRLKIAGITVAGLPYAEQADPSVKRRTGWLMPNFKRGKSYGYGVITPYFWELAQNYDLTFSPNWTTKQGPVADVEWRHRLNNGEYSVRGYGAYQFDQTSPSNDNQWRGALTTKGKFELAQDWDLSWNGTLPTDRTFMDDYDFNSSELITSDVSITGLWDRTYVSAQMLSFMSSNLSEDQSTLPVALPYISGDHTFADPVIGGELSVNWSLYSLYRENAETPFDDVNHGTTQTRAVSELNWQNQMISDIGAVITPFAKLRSDIYITDGVPDAGEATGFHESETTVRILPTVGIDMRMPFVASFDSGQSIVSPVFQIIAASDETNRDVIGNEDAITLNFDHSSLFLSDRFTGLDRFEGGTRANLGLTYSFLGANGGFIRGSVGESFHIAGENSFDVGSGLDGGKSDLVGAITVQPVDWFNLSYQARMEEDFSAVNRQEGLISLDFERFSASVGYLNIGAEPYYGRIAAEEFIESEAKFQLTEGWSVFGGLRYDLKSDIFRSKTAGVEFDCDCMNFKLSYTETEPEDTTEIDRAVMLSLELRTLGKSSVAFGF